MELNIRGAQVKCLFRCVHREERFEVIGHIFAKVFSNEKVRITDFFIYSKILTSIKPKPNVSLFCCLQTKRETQHRGEDSGASFFTNPSLHGILGTMNQREIQVERQSWEEVGAQLGNFFTRKAMAVKSGEQSWITLRKSQTKAGRGTPRQSV